MITIICYEHPLTVIYPLRKKGAYIHEGVMNHERDAFEQYTHLRGINMVTLVIDSDSVVRAILDRRQIPYDTIKLGERAGEVVTASTGFISKYHRTFFNLYQPDPVGLNPEQFVNPLLPHC